MVLKAIILAKEISQLNWTHYALLWILDMDSLCAKFGGCTDNHERVQMGQKKLNVEFWWKLCEGWQGKLNLSWKTGKEWRK